MTVGSRNLAILLNLCNTRVSGFGKFQVHANDSFLERGSKHVLRKIYIIHF